MQDNPFEFIEHIEASEVVRLLEGELSFIQGAALCMLPPVASARILAGMDEGRRRDVAAAMSKSRQMPPDVLRDIADELKKKSNPWSGSGSAASAGGIAQQMKMENGNPEHEAQALVEQEMKKQGFSQMLSKLAGKQLQKNEAKPKRMSDSGPREFAASIRPPESKQKASSSSMSQQGTSPEQSEDASRREQALALAMQKMQDKKMSAKAPAVGQAQGKGVMKQEGGKMANGVRSIDGKALMAHILREADPSVRKLVSNELPGLYEELHGQMFDFADLELSDAKSLGMIFAGVDAETAALALRFASDKLKEKAFTAMSKRKAAMIVDEIKAASGKKIKLSDIDDAQQRVIEFAVGLQDKGQVLIDPDDPQLI